MILNILALIPHKFHKEALSFRSFMKNFSMLFIFTFTAGAALIIFMRLAIRFRNIADDRILPTSRKLTATSVLLQLLESGVHSIGTEVTENVNIHL